MKKIGVLGAGTWGMALSRMLCLSGHSVTVWSALEKEIDEFSVTRRHPNLPGMEIPEQVAFTKEIRLACEGMDIVLFAVPSPFVRSTARLAAPYITAGQIVVDVAKGMEKDTLFTMTQIIGDELKNPAGNLVALSGPTHAEEVAKDLPTTIVSACEDMAAAKLVQEVFTSACMRVYTNTDVLGVELCGAMKNIMALGSGIALGLGFGDNIKAALITRGMAEIVRLGRAMGCDEHTFYGLAGVGDLIVTATSVHSRNNRCGMLLGKGVKPEDAIKQVGMVVEGIHALSAAMRLMEHYRVDMPIVRAVNNVVNCGADPYEEVMALMHRDQKPEI